MRFFFHFNRPMTQRVGKAIVSLHYKNQCVLVEGVDCGVATVSRIKPKSPRFVMVGEAQSIEIVNKIAVIR